MEREPERIYLQPKCCAEHNDYGRLWCEHADELHCEECEPTGKPVAYILEATALAEREGERAEIARLREENAALRHWAWGHIDALLLYAAGSYPKDSHVKDAVAFCRLLNPKRKLRMDPLEASDFHPARATLSDSQQ